MGKPTVFITRKLPEHVLAPLKEIAEVKTWESLEEPIPYHILEEEVKQVEALFTVVSDKVDKNLMEQAPNLKVVANLGVGFDNIDVKVATSKGVYVCNTPDVLSDTTADLAFALLMATARRIVEGHRFVEEGKWKEWHPYLLAGQDIHHKTIGIVGMGRIGEKVAKRATGFEMEILYHNRSRKPDTEAELGASYCSMDELLERADFVVSLAPYTKETDSMFNKEVFQKMKKTAVFINAGRGLVVDEDALFTALQEGQIAAAGLDVFRKEPIKGDHPLLTLPNFVALPHIGSASMQTREAMISLCMKNIRNVLEGKLPETYVNKELPK